MSSIPLRGETEDAQVAIPFNASDGPMLGVEIEIQIVDGAGALATDAAASRVLKQLGDHSGFKHELYECMIEIVSKVSASVADATHDLSTKIDALVEVCDGLGYGILCAGTHPFSTWPDQIVCPEERYHRFIESCQWTTRRLLVFGLHVHVGVESAEQAVVVVNSLATYIPHFLALSSSSPFWQGFDTGLASVRSQVFDSLPNSGPPYMLNNWTDFQRFMRASINADTIRTIRGLAWDVRPRPDFGTIELRMCDGVPTLQELGSIIALSQCLVVWATERYTSALELPRQSAWAIRENKWRAARHGLGAEIVGDNGNAVPLRRSIGEMVARLKPVAERLDCRDELTNVERILTRGTSSTRQRELYARTNDLKYVVDHLVAEMRAGAPVT